MNIAYSGGEERRRENRT